ncbi:CPBP family intramembrane metalloprotease [Candidatus Saccharibacteria bacterium]|nr:CPBP family intramembrane metalloprotease [Candidatus Saccharibacteria bacterium]
MKLEYQNYKHLGWGPIAAVLGTILVFFAGQVLAGTFIIAVLLVMGWDMSRIQDWLGGDGTSQFVLIAVVEVITLALLYLFLRSRNAHPKDIGLIRPRLRDVGYTFLGIGIYIALYISIVAVLTKLFSSLDTSQAQELGFNTDSTGTGLLLVFVGLVILPPITEEIIARGFLYSGLRTSIKFLPAAIITSLLFGVAHLAGGEGGSTIWIAFVDTFILSMVLVYLRERSGSLWAPIGLHGAKNLIAFLALFVFKIA